MAMLPSFEEMNYFERIKRDFLEKKSPGLSRHLVCFDLTHHEVCFVEFLNMCSAEGINSPIVTNSIRKMPVEEYFGIMTVIKQYGYDQL